MNLEQLLKNSGIVTKYPDDIKAAKYYKWCKLFQQPVLLIQWREVHKTRSVLQLKIELFS